MTNRLPISSSVCRQPSTRSKGCPETLRDSLNHVRWSFIPNTHAAPPPPPTHHMISHERSENNSIFHKGVQAGRQTVPGTSHGRLLLSPQQWRSGALAGLRGAPPPRYLCTWKCLWIQVRDRIRSATRAAVYYTTSEGALTLKCESACYRPFFQKPWNNNGLWLERYPWVTLAAFHKVELFTVRWIKERVAAGAGLFRMNGVGGEKFL